MIRKTHDCCWLVALAGLLCLSVPALELEPDERGTARIRDAAASGREAVAMRIEEEGAVQRWALGHAKPGLHELQVWLRLHAPPAFDANRLILSLEVRQGGSLVGQQDVRWTELNAAADHYTRLSLPVRLRQAGNLQLVVNQAIQAQADGAPGRMAVPVKAPKAGSVQLENTAGDEALDDLTAVIMADEAVAIETLDYPAILLDRAEVAAVTTLAVEQVRPERVHVYPGEPNPVTVTLRNDEPRARTVSLRLRLLAGLEDELSVTERELTIPANGVVAEVFAWTAGQREFGFEANAEVREDGQLVHTRSDFFGVGTPIWKTAIQGSGFLTWYGREDKLVPHVEANRRMYVNVEEAFSWQPSSWDDLTPDSETWWSGQNNYHNSLSGLKLWIEHSHRHGIKMITYVWSAASGPSGAATARAQPETITHTSSGIGLTSEFHDVEDLRLYDATHTRPALFDYQYGVWHSFGINRGMFATMVLVGNEIMASTNRFGWDGVRFDSPPSWSAMGAQLTHEEFERFGLSDTMRRLLPEYYDQREGNWSAEAVSIRNARYLRHRFAQEQGPHFAYSSNFGGDQEELTPFLRESLRDGGQLMQEAIRRETSWQRYLDSLLSQVELARQAGGFHTICGFDDSSNLSRLFASIYTLASGTHPYGTSGYTWRDSSSPGRYSQFATRYAGFIWDPALEPVSPAEAGVAVTGGGELWQRFVRRRTRPGRATQTVVHLLASPAVDTVLPREPVPLPPWRKNVTITIDRELQPVVWRLTAEPVTIGERLSVSGQAGNWIVTVPEHRYWTVIVVEDQP